MDIADFDFDLPEEQIAAYPLAKRDNSRLLVLHRDHGLIEHKHFSDLIDYLHEGDILVLNDSRVFPARLISSRETGGKIEILLNHELSPGRWQAVGKNLKAGERIEFTGSVLVAKIEKKTSVTAEVSFNLFGEKFFREIEKIGHTPLPPYIEKQREDREDNTDKERYQTVYAKTRGSVAAPTAGLHFTPELLKKIKDKGIKIIEITLHVGLGTFAPIKETQVEKHQIHAEYFSVNKDDLNRIKKAKKENRCVIAVGTTTTRVLEHIFDSDTNRLEGWTKIYIYPGYKFRCIDGLVTNFHLPKSSLLLLVSAFAGKEKILKAYRDAIQKKYRFYSYGDATLII